MTNLIRVRLFLQLVNYNRISKKEVAMKDKEKRLWSKDVTTKWHPPEGFFGRPAKEIARGLRKASDGLAQAMDRLDFYINRSGKNLSQQDRQRLEEAKTILHSLYKNNPR